MKKINQKYSLLTGVISTIAGVLIAINPNDAINVVIRICAVALLVISLLQFISFLLALRDKQAQWGVTAFMTMVLMVAGVVIAIEPEILKSLFMFMLGGVVMLLGVWQYILLGQYRSVGVVVRGKFYITPSVLVVCGLVMMFFPQSSTNVVVCATGVLIALFGVTEIINFFALRIPVSQSNEPRIIIENE